MRRIFGGFGHFWQVSQSACFSYLILMSLSTSRQYSSKVWKIHDKSRCPPQHDTLRGHRGSFGQRECIYYSTALPPRLPGSSHPPAHPSPCYRQSRRVPPFLASARSTIHKALPLHAQASLCPSQRLYEPLRLSLRKPRQVTHPVQASWVSSVLGNWTGFARPSCKACTVAAAHSTLLCELRNPTSEAGLCHPYYMLCILRAAYTPSL